MTLIYDVGPVGVYGVLCQSPRPAIFQETCYADTHFTHGPAGLLGQLPN